MIRLLEPASLEQALKLARFYEQSQTSQTKKGGSYRSNFSPQTSYKFTAEPLGSGINSKSTLITPAKSSETVNLKPRPLTYSQREERRQKGLCFYCDEKFVKGHECKKPQNFLMIAEVENTGDYEGAPIFDEDPNEEGCHLQEQQVILAGLGIQEVQAKGPIQVTGVQNGKSYKILIDGGSTLNLISTNLCEELMLSVQSQTPVTMRLPNGTLFTSSAVCPEFKMKWNDTEITISTHVADLKQWHLILGVDWLSQLGDVRCNY